MRIFCAWCRKREWVDGLWVERSEIGKGHSHGLCYTCARRLGVDVDALLRETAAPATLAAENKPKG